MAAATTQMTRGDPESLAVAAVGPRPLVPWDDRLHHAPPGYTAVAVVDLAQRGYADEVVHRLTLDRETTADFYFALQDVQSGPVEIAMTGPAGFHTTFLRLGAGAEVGRATVQPRDLLLQQGEYEIHFTFPQTPGRVLIATKFAIPEG